ncbi:MAG: nucleotidyltransferase domain-containing protein [Nitrospirae bacterium]|nr:nucleotidyltransferase domain-containing protein [Nitrospirota bacterium]
MRLSGKTKKIVEEFKRKIESAFPGELISLTLFGSRVRGGATRESDLDLLVVIRSRDWRVGDRIRELGYLLELEHGIVLSIQVLSQRYVGQLKGMRSQFLEEVEREGIVV